LKFIELSKNTFIFSFTGSDSYLRSFLNDWTKN